MTEGPSMPDLPDFAARDATIVHLTYTPLRRREGVPQVNGCCPDNRLGEAALRRHGHARDAAGSESRR